MRCSRAAVYRKRSTIEDRFNRDDTAGAKDSVFKGDSMDLFPDSLFKAIIKSMADNQAIEMLTGIYVLVLILIIIIDLNYLHFLLS